jgi:hypothetical protein
MITPTKSGWLWAVLLTASFLLCCSHSKPLPTQEADCSQIVAATDKWLEERDVDTLLRTGILDIRHRLTDWTCIGSNTALVDILVDMVFAYDLGNGKELVCSSFKLSLKSTIDINGNLSVEHMGMEILKLDICKEGDIWRH